MAPNAAPACRRDGSCTPATGLPVRQRLAPGSRLRHFASCPGHGHAGTQKRARSRKPISCSGRALSFALSRRRPSMRNSNDPPSGKAAAPISRSCTAFTPRSILRIRSPTTSRVCPGGVFLRHGAAGCFATGRGHAASDQGPGGTVRYPVVPGVNGAFPGLRLQHLSLYCTTR